MLLILNFFFVQSLEVKLIKTLCDWINEWCLQNLGLLSDDITGWMPGPLFGSLMLLEVLNSLWLFCLYSITHWHHLFNDTVQPVDFIQKLWFLWLQNLHLLIKTKTDLPTCFDWWLMRGLQQFCINILMNLLFLRWLLTLKLVKLVWQRLKVLFDWCLCLWIMDNFTIILLILSIVFNHPHEMHVLIFQSENNLLIGGNCFLLLMDLLIQRFYLGIGQWYFLSRSVRSWLGIIQRVSRFYLRVLYSNVFGLEFHLFIVWSLLLTLLN